MYYNSGIGMYARPSWCSFKHFKQVMENKFDLTIAWYDLVDVLTLPLSDISTLSFASLHSAP
jgi:hypothetical protein